MSISARQSGLLIDLSVLVAGLAVPLAFAPHHHAWLVFPALALLLYSWLGASPGRAFRRGYLFGLGQFGFGVYWLHISINLFGGVNLVLALTATYLLVAFLALYPAVTGWLLSRYCRSRPLLALAVAAPALWTLSEWLRSWILTGFPWLNLGYSQIETPLAGYAPLLGVYGVTWFGILVAGLLTSLLIMTSQRQRLVAVLIIVAVFIAGYAGSQYQWVQSTGDPKRVALVQGAVPQEIKWEPQQLRDTMQLYYGLTRPFWKNTDLVVWPETAIPAFAHQLGDYLDLLREHAIQLNSPLVTGLATRDETDGRYYNSLLVIGNEEDIYHKRHLVPFGEYLPLEPLLGPLLHFMQVPMSDFSAGNADKPLLKIGTMQAAASICYEDVFGEEVIEALPEAGFLLNVSNDAWFGDSIAPHQHLQMARFRSLETGRYMLRATNTGITAVINHKGRVIARSPQFASDVLVTEMRLYSGSTPYVMTGNMVIIWFCLLCLAAVVIVNRRQVQNGE